MAKRMIAIVLLGGIFILLLSACLIAAFQLIDIANKNIVLFDRILYYSMCASAVIAALMLISWVYFAYRSQFLYSEINKRIRKWERKCNNNNSGFQNDIEALENFKPLPELDEETVLMLEPFKKICSYRNFFSFWTVPVIVFLVIYIIHFLISL